MKTLVYSKPCFLQVAISYPQYSSQEEEDSAKSCFLYFLPVGQTRVSQLRRCSFFYRRNMKATFLVPKCCSYTWHCSRATKRNTIKTFALPLFRLLCASYIAPKKYQHHKIRRRMGKNISFFIISCTVGSWIGQLFRWLLITSVSLLSLSLSCSASSIDTQGFRQPFFNRYLSAEVTLHPPEKLPSNWKSRPEDNGKHDHLCEKRRSSSFVTEAVKAVGPSVVRIDTERKISTANDPLLEDPFFKKFFGDEFQRQLPRERTERGQGSGFIISKDGLILTNAHVVKNVEKVTVTLTDGRAYVGTVKGTDDLLDLAVIRIDPKGRELPVAPLGNSSELQVGDWVIALGNPVGLDNTVTLGIVSSLNRSAAEVGIPEKKIDFIQTDAAINPGNSGGPLVNEFGQVVGINAAIRANAEGIGFAIPIDKAKAISDALAKGKKIQHPFIGIQMSTITPELAKQNNEDPNAPIIIPEVEGALIVRILPKTPAAEAGLRRFDVIQAVDGHNVRSAKEVQSYVDNVKVGQVIHMKVVRGGDKTLTVAVRTGDLNNIKESKTEPILEDE
ncbi:serine-type endopeptidase [Galdieria sulphuraria]|uniref:Serine-type endopeptidase n=1 Tax=Galdieria sulphuraria TaxID=130081 RepID=M2XYW7_GALSU|nr:serine-type endopeptidase [Galdieria sulphuraria]EME28759.1 serine-type endopeptidase [Galdieria sulphuraria]|eukprot:XP_005705279.1 serine-type endopeptidase [Galdieria sulphuraria]